MRPVPVGAKGSFTLVVMPEHLANNFKDAMLPPVLSTPVMIMIMENAALNALKPYLEPGEWENALSARTWLCAMWRRRRSASGSPARPK